MKFREFKVKGALVYGDLYNEGLVNVIIRDHEDDESYLFTAPVKNVKEGFKAVYHEIRERRRINEIFINEFVEIDEEFINSLEEEIDSLMFELEEEIDFLPLELEEL